MLPVRSSTNICARKARLNLVTVSNTYASVVTISEQGITPSTDNFFRFTRKSEPVSSRDFHKVLGKPRALFRRVL